VLTSERHLSLYAGHGELEKHRRQYGLAQFADKWADGGDQVAPRHPKSDIAGLRKVSKAVQHFVDLTVAHTDDRGWKEDVTFAEIDDAIDTIGEKAQEVRATAHRRRLGDVGTRHSGAVAADLRPAALLNTPGLSGARVPATCP